MLHDVLVLTVLGGVQVVHLVDDDEKVTRVWTELGDEAHLVDHVVLVVVVVPPPLLL